MSGGIVLKDLYKRGLQASERDCLTNALQGGLQSTLQGGLQASGLQSILQGDLQSSQTSERTNDRFEFSSVTVAVVLLLCVAFAFVCDWV